MVNSVFAPGHIDETFFTFKDAPKIVCIPDSLAMWNNVTFTYDETSNPFLNHNYHSSTTNTD